MLKAKMDKGHEFNSHLSCLIFNRVLKLCLIHVRCRDVSGHNTASLTYSIKNRVIHTFWMQSLSDWNEINLIENCTTFVRTENKLTNWQYWNLQHPLLKKKVFNTHIFSINGFLYKILPFNQCNKNFSKNLSEYRKLFHRWRRQHTVGSLLRLTFGS